MTLMPLLTLGGALVQLLGVILIAWWMVRGLWVSGTRCWRYVRVPAGTVYLSADHSLLTVGDVVTMRGRADDGVVFNVKRTIAALNDTRVTLSSIALLVLLLGGSIGAQCVKPCDPPPSTCLKNCDPPPCVKNCDPLPPPTEPCVKNCTPPPNDPCVKNCAPPPPPTDPSVPYVMTAGDLTTSWLGNDSTATLGVKARVSGIQVINNNRDAPGVNPVGAGWLNLEHFMRGVGDPLNWFEPRLGHFDLSVIDAHTVRLTRLAQDSLWGLPTVITYTSVAPNIVDVDVRFTVLAATRFLPYNDILAFFASYTAGPLEVAPHFRGIAGPGQAETWLTMPITADDMAPAIRHVTAIPLLYDAPSTFDLAYSFASADYPRYTQPFYCGVYAQGMVYELMFDRASTPVDEMRFVIYQTKVVDDNRHPAWDWEYIVHRPVSGQTYGFKARMGWRRGTLEDCRADYATWAASLP